MNRNLILAGAAFLVASAYVKGRVDGGLIARAQCLAEKAEVLREATEAVSRARESTAQVEADLRAAHAEEIRRVQEAAAAADDRARRLERLLQQAEEARRAAAGGGDGPEAGGGAGADGPAGEPGGLGDLGEARATFTAACIRDAERLSALQATVRRYMAAQASYQP